MKVTSDTGPFAIVPEWVLDAPISDSAVRLYAVLARYADKDDGRCHPGRNTLASRMRCSPRTVDRSLAELEHAGAISKAPRFNEGAQQSNQYVVRRVPLDTGVAPPRQECRPPLDTRVATPSSPVSPKRESMNESQENENPTRADRDRVFDALAQVFGPPQPKARASLYAMSAGEILECAGANVSAAEVIARATAIRTRYGARAGPRSVSMHWHDTPVDDSPGWLRGIESAAKEIEHGRSQSPARPAPLALPGDPAH